MSAPLKTYDLSTVFLTINGIRIQGFDEDDAVSVEAASDDIEDSVGADGQVTASRTNDNRMYADISVRENSQGCQDLGLLQATQRLAPTITPLPFLLIDGQTGEKMSSEFTTFMTTPGPSKGRLVSGRTFRVMLPNAKSSILFAPVVTG